MTVVTITGIRPDFIRMSKVFEKLDNNFSFKMLSLSSKNNVFSSFELWQKNKFSFKG
jgi:UDP-N-acetylglucosamine 2-epimerase